MARRRNTSGPTIEQNGEAVRMEDLELDTIPSILAACSKTFNGVKNKTIDDKMGGQMNRATMIALKAQSVLIQTLVQAEVGKQVLQQAAAQLTGLSPVAITDGTQPSQPARRKQKRRSASSAEAPASSGS